MSTRVQWLGHAGLLVEGGGRRILVDPFLTGNPKAAADASTIAADAILLSHGHGDHLGDTIAIAKRTGIPVVSNFEVGEYLGSQGLTNLESMNHGGGIQLFDEVHVQLTWAVHSSSLPGGGYGGNPCGFLIKFADGTRIYDAADTALFGDMALIAEGGIDLAILPIGDYYTMGPSEAIRAIKLIQPRLVMPIHYDTFPPIRQDAHAWAEKVRQETAATPVVPEPGGWVEVS
jgi:L-ascorbate metabolism protein UlaG (beta-lactamase superfamily)